MSNLIKPGHTSLNMEDIAEDLEIVHGHVKRLSKSNMEEVKWYRDNKDEYENPFSVNHIDKLRSDASNASSKTQKESQDLVERIENESKLEVQIEKYGTADDTAYVGKIPADRIAISVEGDRTSVNNALNLGGQPAENYFLTKDGNSVIATSNNMQEVYSAEILDLRDEIIQLRMELAKFGLINSYKPYAGFYDEFNEYRPKHLYGVIAYVTGSQYTETANIQDNVSVADGVIDSFAVGDQVYVMSLLGDRPGRLVRITRIVGTTIYFNASVGFPIISQCETQVLDDNGNAIKNTDGTNKTETINATVIYRSHGTIINRSFAFGEVKGESPNDQEYFTGLSNDENSGWLRINSKNTGFAHKFKIPSRYQDKFITRLGVHVRRTGSPAPLMAYLLYEKDLDRWQNPTQAKNALSYYGNKGLIIAESDPLSLPTENMGDALSEFVLHYVVPDPNVESELPDDIEESVSITSPVVDKNIYDLTANPYRYPRLSQMDKSGEYIKCVLIITTLNGDSTGLVNDNNFYELMFVAGKNSEGDLETLNKSFYYNTEGTKIFDDEVEFAYSDGTTRPISNIDLYYEFKLRGVDKQKFVPFNNGVYAATFTTHEPIRSTRFRTTMRINREGMYTVDFAKDSSGTMTSIANENISDGGSLKIKGSGTYSTPNLMLKPYIGESDNLVPMPVVIDYDIRHVQETQGQLLTIDKGLHINTDKSIIVYPVPYQLSVMAYLDVWDPEKCTMETLDQERINLDFKTVMPDQYKANRHASDRLIFEGDFPKDLDGDYRKFNRFVLEVDWTTSRSDNNMPHSDFIGRIFDLSAAVSDAMFVNKLEAENVEEP